MPALKKDASPRRWKIAFRDGDGPVLMRPETYGTREEALEGVRGLAPHGRPLHVDGEWACLADDHPWEWAAAVFPVMQGLHRADQPAPGCRAGHSAPHFD